jgi:tetratricopeptide (TPR) repeat protein
MKKSVFTAWCLVLAIGASRAVPAETREAPRFLTPPEVTKIITTSDVVYRIDTGLENLEDVNAANTVDKLFPLSVRPIRYPVRVQNEDGSTAITEALFRKEAVTILGEAEGHFIAERFPEAILDYQRIIDRYPDCYLAYAHLGDSYYRMRQIDKAIECFDTAIALNPFDHQTYLYKADALMGLGRCDEAKAAYIHSLSLCPRYDLALANLRHFAAALGVEIRTDLFQPQTYVRPEPDSIAIYVGNERSLALWLPYGLVKAIWQGEPSHRQKVLGDPNAGATYAWSSIEEKEALLNLVMVYQSWKQEGRVQPDPKLDLLTEIVEAGDLPGFILYEIASRMCPYITLTRPEEERESLRGFIAKYIVVPVTRAPVTDAGSVVAAESARPGVLEDEGSQHVAAR